MASAPDKVQIQELPTVGVINDSNLFPVRVGTQDFSVQMSTIANKTLEGNAASATKLANERTIGINGDITATPVGFDGTSNITITASVNNDSHSHTGSTISALDGSDITTGTVSSNRLPVATNSNDGIMTSSVFNEHVVNNAKVSDINHNVTTNLSTSHNASTVVINSSDGNNATINAATASTAGIMSEAIFDQHVINNAKVGITPTQASNITTNNAKVSDINHNVTTNLAVTTTTTSVTVTSSDGTNGTIPAATASKAGVLTSADKQLLDGIENYEEGVWTPTIEFGGASVGISYGFQIGRYVKIGNLVTAYAYVTLTSKGSSTGSAEVGGLPFTPQNFSAHFIVAATGSSFVSNTGTIFSYAQRLSDSVKLQSTTSGGSTSDLTNSNFNPNSWIMINVSYRTA